jgi:3-oxoadipate enol-lactonase
MFLTINDHTLHIATVGEPDRPVVMLLHSLGTSAALWEQQAASLASEYFVICPEFRGHGLSAESGTPLTCEALAEDMLAILSHLGIGRFALAGVSLGGVVAQIVAGRAGKNVTGLVVFDSYIVSLNPQMWRDRAAKIRADGLAAIAPAVLKIWMTDADALTTSGAGLKRMLEMASDEGYAAACDALAVADNRDITPRISCPTIVAVGSEDHAAPVTASQAVAEAIPGAVLDVIEGAAHIPLLHHANRCTEIIRRIL